MEINKTCFLDKPVSLISQHWGKDTIPLVSISCITYNHDNYIREAIEGFLMQKTTFPVEILIHDDASTDKTASIVREYEEKYPHLIKPIYQTENQYSKRDGSIGRIQRGRARGKYYAICEGDDYWTDPLKLQKQVDFLEENPEYSGCSHQTRVIYSDGFKNSHVFREKVNSKLELIDMLEIRKFHTASVMFRNSIIKKHEFPIDITAGDRAINLLLASYGPIRFIPEVMCVYRKGVGVSSWVTVEMMKKDLNMIPWIININPQFPKNRYKSFIYKTIFSYPSRIKISNIFKYYFLFIIYSFSFFPKNIITILHTTFLVLPKSILKQF